ncbi:MAG TPA: hypothetical protein ENI20_05950 [Bacteroides sp.]|nr:hypothetical protein [Bacteroides sp.]
MRFSKSICIFVIVAIFTGSVCSCKNKRETESSTTKEPGKFYQHEFRRRLDAVNPGLKDPSAIISLLESTGAEFLPDLINNSGLDSIYLLDSAAAAVNLGIYTVDLVYLIAYDKNEMADVQLSKARKLADKIGATHLYDHGMYNRYRQAGVHPDTLIKYFSKAAEQMEHEYSSMQLLRLYTLFATGEFIEKLHLTSSLLIHAEEHERDYYWTVMLLVFQQERALDQLILLLDQIREQEEGDRFMAMMNDLKLIFMEMTDSRELSGINTQNIAENQLFREMVEQLGYIRNWVIHPTE